MQPIKKKRLEIVLRVSHGKDDCMHIVKVSSPNKASNFKYNSNNYNYSQVVFSFRDCFDVSYNSNCMRYWVHFTTQSCIYDFRCLTMFMSQYKLIEFWCNLHDLIVFLKYLYTICIIYSLMVLKLWSKSTAQRKFKSIKLLGWSISQIFNYSTNWNKILKITTILKSVRSTKGVKLSKELRFIAYHGSLNK